MGWHKLLFSRMQTLISILSQESGVRAGFRLNFKGLGILLTLLCKAHPENVHAKPVRMSVSPVWQIPLRMTIGKYQSLRLNNISRLRYCQNPKPYTLPTSASKPQESRGSNQQLSFQAQPVKLKPKEPKPILKPKPLNPGDHEIMLTVSKLHLNPTPKP